MRLLRFKKRYQSGGMIGGGSNFITMTNRSTFKPRQTGIALQPAPVAQFPNIDKSKLSPNIDGMIAELKGKGHTNEVNQLYQMKKALDSQLQSLSDLDILGNSERYKAIMNGYAKLTSPSVLNELIVSKSRTDQAYQDAAKKGITGQYVVKEDSMMVKNNKNEIKTIPIDKLDEYQAAGYSPVSVQELNDLRDYVPELAGRYDLDAYINWGVNGDQLRNRVRDVFANVGYKLTGKDNKSFDIREINGSLYEINSEGGYRLKDNYSRLQEAFNTLMKSFTQEEIDTMKSNAVMYLMRSGRPVNRDNISAVVNQYLVSSMNRQHIYEYENKDGASIGNNLGSGGSNKMADLSLNQAEAVMGDPVSFDITLPSGMVMNIRGSNFANIMYGKDDIFTGTGDNRSVLSVINTRINEVGDLNKSRVIGASSDAKPVPPREQLAYDPRSLVYTYTLRRKGTDRYIINEDSEIGKRYAEAMKKIESERGNSTQEQQLAKIKALNQKLQKELGESYEVVPIVIYKAVIPNSSEYRGTSWLSDWTRSWAGGNPAFRKLTGEEADIYERKIKEVYGDDTGVELLSKDGAAVVTMFAPASSEFAMRSRGAETVSKVETPPQSDDAYYLQQQALNFDRRPIKSNNAPTIDIFNNK
jgi:hypothetical protein